MLEKSYTNSDNSDDVTRVKSADTHGELSPDSQLSASQTTDEEATRITSHTGADTGITNSNNTDVKLVKSVDTHGEFSPDSQLSAPQTTDEEATRITSHTGADTGITNSNSTDVTLVKSVDTHGEFSPDSQLSAPQTTDEEATRIISHTDTKSIGTSTAVDSQLYIGSVVKNTYRLDQVLGEGGMGSVFKALNKDWEGAGARDPYVALKVLKPELSDNKELVMGLFREFDRIKMLSECPNNVRVYDFGRDGTNVFMTMEYLTGQTLSEYINRQPTSLAHAWFIIEGVGNALAFAHKHNIVHRDIKPGNIFVTKNGVVKVLDFGIASKINENEDDKTKFNGDDIGAFTLAYASPDTRLGDPPDCRDDIYSFACVIYEILTGKKFFDPKRRSKKAEQIHGLNSKQMEALNKALAFERDLRTPSIRELLDKLRPVKTPWVKYGSIGSGVVTIAGIVLWWSLSSTDVKQPPTPEVKQVPVQTPVVLTPEVKQIPVVPTPEVKQVPVVPTPAVKQVPENKPIEPSNIATSSNGIIHLETSKPEYQNGEFFHLSFTLTEPSYVRVIDRDAKGEVTTLRPNPSQVDKLLPADKEHIFPPQGIDVPVQGSSGNSTITIVASTRPFPKGIKLLNTDGSVSDQVQSGEYSWTQVHYTLRD
ncbi:MAG: DUF4384 domain-containing protein [Methylococcales bacterium]|nr:DUF4384 domain-containing protein [Methylococcales bacterium]